jgi:hypothetical protein
MLYNPLGKLLFFVFLFGIRVQASEFYEPFQSTRQLAMGGVYVFSNQDGSSFMQNPAYTCFTKGLNWTVGGISLAVGDLENYTFLSDKNSAGTLAPTMATLSEYMGKKVSIRGDGYTSMSLPCFGMAITYTKNANFQVQNPAYPHIDTFYLTDSGFFIGGGFLLGLNLALGLDIKRVQRVGGAYTFGPESLADLTGSSGLTTLTQSIENGGYGYGIDTGLVARFGSTFLNPTASLSWRDVGSTAFTMTSGLSSPNRQKDNLVFGLTFDGSIPFAGIAGGLEYRHITDTNEQIGKKIHLGMELSIAMMDIRAGFYQGYTTYGAGVDLWLFQLEGALYSVEQGAYPGQTPEQRGQIGLSVDLSFDPDFKLMDAGGKRRRLKQRR